MPWYALHGHHLAHVADRCRAVPWCTAKTEPSFADLLAKLRRIILAIRFLLTSPGQATDAGILAVHRAWALASDDLAA